MAHPTADMKSSPDRTPRRDFVLWGGLLAALAGCLVYGAGMYIRCGGELHGILDDAYIHFQYARAIAEGHPFRYFAQDSMSSGGTSFIYPFILSLGYLAGFTGWMMMIPAFLLGMLTFLAGLAILYRTVQDEMGLAAARIFFALILPVGVFWYGFLGGMEGGLFFLMLTLVVRTGQQFIRTPDARHHRAFALAAGLTPLVRPEGIVAVGTYFLIAAWVRCIDRRLTAPRWIIASVAPFLSLMTLNYLLFGMLDGNSAIAKSHFHAPQLYTLDAVKMTLGGWFDFFDEAVAGNWNEHPITAPFFWTAAAAGALLMLGRTIWRQRPGLGVLLPLLFMGTLIPSATYSYTWGVYRYFLPFLPLMYIAGAALLALAWRGRRAWKLLVLAALLHHAASFGVKSHAHYFDIYRRSGNNLQTQQVACGRYIDARLPADARVVINDAGAIAYFGNRPTYDFIGLTTRGVATAYRGGEGTIMEAMEQSFRHEGALTHLAMYRHWLPVERMYGKLIKRFTSRDREGLGHTVHELYAFNPRAFEYADIPFTVRVPDGWVQQADMDVADLHSEQFHSYVIYNAKAEALTLHSSYYRSRPFEGKEETTAGDGCRAVHTGDVETFTVSLRRGPALLILRTSGADDPDVEISVNGFVVNELLRLTKGSTWMENAVEIHPGALTSPSPAVVRIKVLQKTLHSCHYWIYQPAAR